MTSCSHYYFTLEFSSIPEVYCFAIDRLNSSSREEFGALGGGELDQPLIMQDSVQHHAFEWVP